MVDVYDEQTFRLLCYFPQRDAATYEALSATVSTALRAAADGARREGK